MDSIFQQSEGERAAFVQHMMQSFGCSYICLWSFLPQPDKCLIYLDGAYHERSSQASSSSGSSLVRRLFDAYCQSPYYVDNGRVPGIAFKNNLPYMELNLQDLLGMASNEVQMQFYVNVVFMGCAKGEIELGMSGDARVGFEMEVKNWFPLDFSRQLEAREDPQTTDQKRGSSSSSSLRSLSVDSSEYSSLLFNIPAASFILPEASKAPLVENTTALGLLTVPSSSITTSPLHEAIHSLTHMRSNQLPTVENEDAAITKAILAVLSSDTSSTPLYQTTQNIPHIPPIIIHNPSAFSSYRQGLSSTLMPIAARTSKKQNLFRRAMLFFRNLDIIRRQQEQVQVGKHPTTTQLHHMISERRRREKLNESFQILRSFLPPGSKKDKASVLNNTVEYLSSLKKQVEELGKKNQILEAQILPPRSEAIGDDPNQMRGSSSVERLTNVQITRVSTSTSESRMLDVNVTINGECSLLDLVIRITEFLKSQNNLSLMTIEGNTRPTGESTNSVHGIMFRLRNEGEDFDESSFQEAVKRLVDDETR
ncbi:transcription factor bHLH041 isoform X1 [Olea europaea subsp. europaea]|uniref:Transcription factor bHLH041 isoform X1 n=3 Tax=Olea europaea subsp. europaea TaxID=158383 RepID=A0A8S0SKR0_OLEEU|nr:transcription factor bHLH041 isoform X1 [Olea europaea subsp. europaea]